jgi:hypothetical protein
MPNAVKARFSTYSLGFMVHEYWCGWFRLALTLPNERVDPVQNSQRVAAALGYSYLRVGYCNTDLLTKPDN